MKPVAVLLACLGLALLLTGGASPPPSPDIRPVRTIVVPRRTRRGAGLAHRTYPCAHGRKPRLPHRWPDDRAPGRCGRAVMPGDLSPNSTRSRSATPCVPRKPSLPRRRPPCMKLPTTWSASRRWSQGWSTRVQFDAAERAFLSAKADVDAAAAQLHDAEDQLGYTNLLADAAGAVIATGAEAGEVVRAGQTIVTVAHDDGADAVFDVPATFPPGIARRYDHRHTDRRSERPHGRTSSGAGAAGGSGDAQLPGQGRLDRTAGRHAAGRDGLRADPHAGSERYRAAGNRADHGGQQAGRLGGRSRKQQVSLRPVELRGRTFPASS